MTNIYNLYSSDENHLGISKSYHIQCDLPPHKFRQILMEFRQNNTVGNDIQAFVDYLKETFPESFHTFDYDDVVQFDADQENSAILTNLTDQMNKPV
ncbi:hypothetical protein CEQ21_00410 [Niallia circulans]|uniref:Uncharacterized protein n=1 Tax=Niallia circulans TaxID=1397 RepID=A0A553SR50_NIACI|nr:hypothetical protein [Niallia circulans]TRZ39474.1 hypothetical protein CEQ21_00410 [Niallia circulans]